MTLMAATLRLGPWAVGALAAYNGSPPDFRQAGWSSWACAPVWSAAMTAALLDLPQDPVALRELNADLHCHSTVSDGTLAPAEVAALHRGGVQRIYLGNVRSGPHELVAFFVGKGPHDRDYRRGATVKFDTPICRVMPSSRACASAAPASTVAPLRASKDWPSRFNTLTTGMNSSP